MEKPDNAYAEYSHVNNMTNKRFMAFEFDHYYPSGASLEFYGFFDTEEDALKEHRGYDVIELYDFHLNRWVTYTKSKYVRE